MPKTIIEPRLLKGFRDYGPVEQAARQDMFRKIQTVFERFGFLPMSTPVLEYKEILMGKYGEDEKLIYSFKDNGDRDVAMRYDLTVSLARYVAQNQNQLILPFKRYLIAPVWRADNPQKGRLREFYQCDIDTVGVTSPLVADTEIIACIYFALTAVGLSDLEIRFSNRMLFYRLFTVPDTEIQTILREIDKLDKIGPDAVISKLQTGGVSEQGIEQARQLMAVGKGETALDRIAEAFPAAADLAGPGGPSRQVAKSITAFGVPQDVLTFDPLLVRGLDYYTNMVFEVSLKNKPEFGSIAGGGRYDGLVDKFSEKSLPAVGGSIGIDRLFEAMQELGLVQKGGLVKALVVNQDENLRTDYIKLVSTLRSNNINSEFYYEPVKLDKQFKYAESKNIEYAVIMGQEEKAKGAVQLKNLQTREQEEVSLNDLATKLQ